MYSLGIPDEEIRQDLSNLFAAVRADKDMDWASQLGGDLLCCEWDRFFRGLKSLNAGVPYGSTEETVHEASVAASRSATSRSALRD